MRGRRRPQTGTATDKQPGFPPGEARLLDFREEAGSVTLVLDSGHRYELAPGSVPVDLPAPGGDLTPEQIASIVLAAERKQVARRVFAMLDRRLQPLARIRDKLMDKGFSREAIDAVLLQMQDQGIYSDRRYAEAYCRDCLLGRAVGRRYLVNKLREKQVAVSLAAAVVEEILDAETEADLAARAARMRWRRLPGHADTRAVAKVVRYLLGRGFPAHLANRAAREERPSETTDEDD